VGLSAERETASRPTVDVVLVSAPRPARRLAEAMTSTGAAVTRVANGAEAATALVDLPGAVVVLAPHGQSSDLALSVRAARSDVPHAPLVLVCPSTTVRETRRLLEEGVDGLVLAAEATRTLSAAVRAVAAGLLVLPSSLRGNLTRPILSAREKQVLGLVVLGLTNREIAGRLHVSESTVKSHLATAFPKLGVRTRSEASARILDPDTGLGAGILAITGGE
jgi:DNA-binding NarL/FixJ family response regulator